MLVALLAAAAVQAAPAPPLPAVQSPPEATPQKQAETVRRYPSTATQGVAVGRRDVWAVSNFRIVRYDKKTGEQKAEWVGERARFPHINSCALIRRELVCASSNYSGVPHVSTVEFFDPQTLEHKRSVSLGLGTGSITWVDRKDGAWWAMFANYDVNGAEAPRDHRWTTLVKFDDEWRRTESWALPKAVLDRVAPMSVSGGGWGPDGRLYLSGHDRPEVYALQLPKGGGVLDLIETYGVEVEGQAVDWDESEPGMLYGITRRTREILAMRMPVAR